MSDYIIEAQNLVRRFGSRKSLVTAVDNVSFGIEEGEVVCLVRRKRLWQDHDGKDDRGLLSRLRAACDMQVAMCGAITDGARKIGRRTGLECRSSIRTPMRR